MTWSQWLAEVGAGGVDASRGLHFAQTQMSLQAAIAGQGVALTNAVPWRARTCRRPPGARRCRRRSAATAATGSSARRRALAQPRIAAFRAWLLEEAARERGEAER